MKKAKKGTHFAQALNEALNNDLGYNSVCSWISFHLTHTLVYVWSFFFFFFQKCEITRSSSHNSIITDWHFKSFFSYQFPVGKKQSSSILNIFRNYVCKKIQKMLVFFSFFFFFFCSWYFLISFFKKHSQCLSCRCSSSCFWFLSFNFINCNYFP